MGYGYGTVYQRKSDGRWCAAVDLPSARGERNDKKLALERGDVGTDTRETVKGWSDRYLEMRLRDLSPKGYNAAASPLRRWVVPTIGRKRLDQLTPADLRAVADAQRNALGKDGKPDPRKPATIEATHRAMMTMLRYAVREGYTIPARVMEAKPPPKAGKSDRIGMTVPEGLACIEQASALPDGTRWLVTLLYGMRQGECLGLTWDAIDFEAGEFGEIRIEWQLQALPYIDRKNKRAGFRVPVGYEARHLIDSYHLVRPKSRQGYRVAPLLPPIRDALLRWREWRQSTRTGSCGPRPTAGRATTSTTAPHGATSR
jgi:integrase